MFFPTNGINHKIFHFFQIQILFTDEQSIVFAMNVENRLNYVRSIQSLQFGKIQTQTKTSLVGKNRYIV